MDWSKTKTMFILVFLVLDVYLLTQFCYKYSKSKLEFIPDYSLEQRLKADDINYEHLPQSKEKSQFISANTKSFTSKDTQNLTDQKVTINDSNNSTISSIIKNPIALKGKMSGDSIQRQLDPYVKNNIVEGNKYSYCNYDKNKKQIEYCEQYNFKTIYNNMSGHIIFYLNNKNQVTSYDQTLLNDIKVLNDEQDVLPAIQAVEALHTDGMLKPNSKIIDAELGYYTMVQLTEVQVLVPTWHLVVEHNHKQLNFFVNAFEGQVFQTDNNENKILE